MSGGGLWDWVVRAYALPGVEAACLTLQDEFGQNVPLLLWAAWSGLADPDLSARAAAAARGWERDVVGQLRVARRALKIPALGVAEAGRERLRGEIKAAELAAERLLLEGLEMLTPACGRATPVAALKVARAAWGGSPDAPVAELAGLLGPHGVGR